MYIKGARQSNLSDVMRKSIYDPENIGVVNTAKNLQAIAGSTIVNHINDVFIHRSMIYDAILGCYLIQGE